MNEAILVFLVLFGVFALISGVTWSMHRAWARAVVTALGGALLIAYALFVVYPTLSRPDPSPELDRLQAMLATARQETARVQQRAEVLRTEKTAAEDALGAAALAERRRQTTVLAGLRTIDGVRADVVDFPPGSDASAGAIAFAHRQIVGDIETLRDLWSRRSAVVPANADSTRDLMRLRDRMAARLETEHYAVELYPDKEVVHNRVGRYYVIDLKDATSGVRFQFEGGKYTLNRASAEFRTALNRFVSDIMSRLHGNVKYDLFVRGSADRLPFRGRQEAGQSFGHVRFMRAVAPGKYSNQFAERSFGTEIRNEDLPHLRAAFLQSVVSDVYPTKTPVILEGGVTGEANVRDRNAELILFVDW